MTAKGNWIWWNLSFHSTFPLGQGRIIQRQLSPLFGHTKSHCRLVHIFFNSHFGCHFLLNCTPNFSAYQRHLLCHVGQGLIDLYPLHPCMILRSDYYQGFSCVATNRCITHPIATVGNISLLALVWRSSKTSEEGYGVWSSGWDIHKSLTMVHLRYAQCCQYNVLHVVLCLALQRGSTTKSVSVLCYQREANSNTQSPVHTNAIHRCGSYNCVFFCFFVQF